MCSYVILSILVVLYFFLNNQFFKNCKTVIVMDADCGHLTSFLQRYDSETLARSEVLIPFCDSGELYATHIPECNIALHVAFFPFFLKPVITGKKLTHFCSFGWPTHSLRVHQVWIFFTGFSAMISQENKAPSSHFFLPIKGFIALASSSWILFFFLFLPFLFNSMIKIFGLFPGQWGDYHDHGAWQYRSRHCRGNSLICPYASASQNETAIWCHSKSWGVSTPAVFTDIGSTHVEEHVTHMVRLRAYKSLHTFLDSFWRDCGGKRPEDIQNGL